MEQSFTRFYLYSIFISFICVLYLITQFSFKNGNPTCNNYVFNVYLYLAMSITIIGLFAYLINELVSKNNKEKHELLPKKEIYNKLGMYIFGGIILSFIFIFMLSMTKDFNTKGTFYNHITWLLFLGSISLMIYPYFKSQEIAGIIDDALLSTALVFILMSLIVYYQPGVFKKSYNYVVPGLIVGLLSIIIISLFNIFITQDIEMYKKISVYISYVAILIFSLFVSYDTSHMFEMASKCINFPNYPKSSLSFFLDLLNLFSSFINIYNN